MLMNVSRIYTSVLGEVPVTVSILRDLITAPVTGSTVQVNT